MTRISMALSIVLALVPATAAAFPTGEQFDLDALKEDGGGGIAFTGAPRFQGHTCAVCASCCQVVAINSFEPLPQVTAPPGAQPAHPQVRVVTRIATLPDKPPRV